MHALGHFKTITHHKLLVMGYCFRVGLIRQGLMHDMSKYAWTEFRVGAKYYTGTRSPNAAEREAIGYSTAWLHHKGRNRHHLEYWIDYGLKDMELAGQPMPTKYMVELCLDRIAACRVYHGKDYTDQDPLEYLDRSRDSRLMHPGTRRQVVELLTMLAERGEKETLRYIRRVVLKHSVKCYSNLPEKVTEPGEKDKTFLPPERLRALTKELGTPFYLYSEEVIRAACERLRAAFFWNPGYRQFFPVKAAPTPAILRLLRQQGQGVVCSSAAELTLSRRCGFTPGEIMFLPNYPRHEDIQTAAELGCMVTLDSLELIDAFRAAGLLRGIVGLRINPGGVFRAGTIEARLEGAKMGMSPEDALEAARRLKACGIETVGLHSYLCGNTMEAAYYPALVRLLGAVAERLRREAGVRIGYLNLSGGLGIPYEPGEQSMDLMEIGARVRQAVEAQSDLAHVCIYTELGRYVTGPAGILVTTVQHVKHGARDFAGVDASSADLMRPMLYGAYHHISVAGKEGAATRGVWDVVGAVCENADKLAEKRALPELEAGDVLVIHDVGAHGHSMGYNYGGRLRCGEYMLRADGGIALIRRPETMEDYLSTALF